jgi:predicted metal-dependent hydrolase
MRELHDPGLGTVTFRINPRARRISIRLVAGSLTVTLPSERFYEEGVRFLFEKREKLVARLDEQKKNNDLYIDEDHPLQTQTFITVVKPSQRDKIFFRLTGNTLTVEYPGGKDVRSAPVQQAIKKGIVYFLRKAAREHLPSRLLSLAAGHGFAVNRISVQSGKTRWGSCSGQNNINLSLYLMLLPPHLSDYVLLHELCHTVEHNHSPRFWQLLASVSPASEQLRKELKSHSIRTLF